MTSRLVVAILFMCAAVCMATTPAITGCSPSHLSTTIQTTITITGTDLPDPDSVWISGIECTGANKVSGEITCLAEPGLGQNMRVTVVYEGDKEIHANIIDFEEAVGVTLCSGESDIFVDAEESIHVTVCGANFGKGEDTNDAAGWEGRFAVVVQGGFEATIIYHYDDVIAFELPHGVGANLKVSVALGHQQVEIPDFRVSYPGPITTGITTLPRNSLRSTSVRVAIFGKNFGNPSPFVIIVAYVGQFPCVSINHISSTEFHCTVIGGFGANAPVIVTVNGQSSQNPVTLGGSPVRYDFEDPATPGLDCTPPFGAADVINTELCNCWSGSAPRDNLLSKECTVHAVCPGRLTTQPVVAQFAPSRPETEFRDDKLFIKQTAPVVKNRRDTIIQFVVPALSGSYVPNTPAGTIGSTTCNYPGRIWEKRINDLDCLDEYYGALAWTQNELCGFVEDTSVPGAASRVWKTNLVTSYTETFKKSDGSIHFRKISNSFLVTVSFVRQVVALTTTPVTAIIADENAVTSMDVVVNGDALYDVASKNTIISFTTTMAWPYQIDAVTLTGTWKRSADNTETDDVEATAMLSPTQPGELECDQVQDTECEQAWILTIDTDLEGDQVCNLKGLIEFSTEPLLCRDYTTVGDCQGEPKTNFTIQIGQTDLCDRAPDVDASKGIAATLESFYDDELTIPQQVFQTGDMVYFKLTIVDPVSSIDRVTFADITVRSSVDNSVDDLLYEQTTAGGEVSAADEFLSAAQFNITQELRTPILYAKTKGELHFHFRLLRDVLDVVEELSTTTASDMTQQLTVEVTVDVAYHGNTKRSTVAATLPAVAHSQLTFYDLGATAEDLEPHANDANFEEESFSGFFSPASTVVASVAAVAGAAALVLA